MRVEDEEEEKSFEDRMKRIESGLIGDPLNDYSKTEKVKNTEEV